MKPEFPCAAVSRVEGHEAPFTGSLFACCSFWPYTRPCSIICLSCLKKHPILQSLLFILMTLQARTHYCNFTASRLQLWACGISLKITELSVWCLNAVLGALEALLSGSLTNSRVKPEQIGVGEGRRIGVSTFHVGLNQVPSHSSPGPPGPPALTICS